MKQTAKPYQEALCPLKTEWYIKKRTRQQQSFPIFDDSTKNKDGGRYSS